MQAEPRFGINRKKTAIPESTMYENIFDTTYLPYL